MPQLPTSCNLCPRACGVNRAAGERGVCGAGADMAVARAALHFWEEPPISGESGSGTVFFSFCPLRCSYCQNAAIAEVGLGAPMGVSDLVAAMLDLQGQGALNVNLVTATHYAPLVVDAVACSRAEGMRLPIVWNTSGYETLETLRMLEGTVDVYLTDFKYASARVAARYSQAPDYPDVALAALGEMVRQTGSPAFDEHHGQRRMTRGVVVRHLLLPGCLEDSRRVVELVHERFGCKVLLSIMNQYTPVLRTRADAGDARAAHVLERCPELARRVSDADYEALLDFADGLGVEDYFWQEGGACEESFIPAFSGVRQ